MKLIFPYTFAAASGLLPAQFSYTGTMIRTVDSYFCGIPQLRDEKENHRRLVFQPCHQVLTGTIVNLPAIPNPE